MANPVVHWEIMADDGAAAQEFYRQLFDWDVQVHPEMGNYGVVQKGDDGGIGGGIGTKMHPGAPPVLFYVLVDDLDSYLAKAESLGGTTVVPPTPIPGVGSFAMFNDPQGTTIGLFKG